MLAQVLEKLGNTDVFGEELYGTAQFPQSLHELSLPAQHDAQITVGFPSCGIQLDGVTQLDFRRGKVVLPH